MRRTTYLILFIILLSIFSSCKNPSASNSETGSVNDGNARYTLYATDYDGWRKTNMYLHDGKMIYKHNATYYKYDLLDEITYVIGETANKKATVFHLDSYVIHDNNLYMYEMVDGTVVLYRMDLNANTLERVTEDAKAQSCKSIKIMDNKIVGLKNQTSPMAESISYLDMYELSQQQEASFQIIVSKTYRTMKQTGEIISNYSIYDGTIYVLVREIVDGETTYKIEIYDRNGAYTKTIFLNNKEICEFLNVSACGKFEVIGNYVYIQSVYHPDESLDSSTPGGLLIDISANETIVLQDNHSLVLDISTQTRENGLALLYSNYTKELWEINGKTNEVSKVTFSQNYENIEKIWTSQDGNIMALLDGIYYINFK